MTLDDSPREGMRVPPEEWLDVLQRDYLADYICSGGSAVRFVSGADDTLRRTSEQAVTSAREQGYYTVTLDPSTLTPLGKRPDLHRIDRFFLALTRDVDWKASTDAQVRRFLESNGIRLDGHALADLDGIAAANGCDHEDLEREVEQRFIRPVMRDHDMSLAFRAAATALARAQILPDVVSPTTEEVLLKWLTGQTMPGAAAALKKIRIYERINTTNARHILASFCHWLPSAGHAGLVAILDFRPYEHKRLTKTQRQAQRMRRIREALESGGAEEARLLAAEEADDEPEVTYSDLAYMQMLALLRRFIDEIDWFERFLLVVQTTPGFYDDESRRNYYNYDALQTRIGQEVHDARRGNPAAALVHLGGFR